MSYPKLHLPLRELQSLFQQQLRVEMATTVAVESVEQARVLTEEVLRAVRSSAGSQPRGGAGAGLGAAVCAASPEPGAAACPPGPAGRTLLPGAREVGSPCF